MKKLLKVLILEDIPEDAGLIERVLKKGGISFVSKVVDTREKFEDALTDFNPDVILSDHTLPQFSSTEALQLWQLKGGDIPFILVTGTVSEEFAVSILKQGADDYLLKDNLARLPSAIKSALHQRKGERKRREAEAALCAQNIELIKVNEELDQFVYSVSHNLRAPLMSMLGLVNLFQVNIQNGQYEDAPAYLSRIEHSIHKLDATIRQILTYSKNSRSISAMGKINLHQLVNGIFEELQYFNAYEREIEKKVTIREDVALYSDAGRLNFIFKNLISNAIKYADPGKSASYIHIDITVNKKEASIQIKDNGIGINPVFLKRVFDMFFRATNKSDGAGLGLYIVKESIEKLKGHIDIQSHPGTGTEILLCIPNNPEPHLALKESLSASAE